MHNFRDVSQMSYEIDIYAYTLQVSHKYNYASQQMIKLSAIRDMHLLFSQNRTKIFSSQIQFSLSIIRIFFLNLVLYENFFSQAFPFVIATSTAT